MPKWGKCDFRELENLQKRMEKLEKGQDAFCRKCAQELAERLLYLVGKRTPVGTIPEDVAEDEKIAQQWEGYTGGTLRHGWTESLPKPGIGRRPADMSLRSGKSLRADGSRENSCSHFL